MVYPSKINGAMCTNCPLVETGGPISPVQQLLTVAAFSQLAQLAVQLFTPLAEELCKIRTYCTFNNYIKLLFKFIFTRLCM